MSTRALHLRAIAASAVAAALFLAGCTGVSGPEDSAKEPSTAASRDTSTDPMSSSPTSSSPTEPAEAPATPVPSDGRAARATLSIPSIGLRGLVVEPYRGWTDDGPGTELQNAGLAGSPYGPRGGTGPGGVGNYQVTAHRNSSTAAFLELPALRTGQQVHVHATGVRYTYRITTTRTTSFRSTRSLAEQRAAVPGRPSAVPTRAMITLSTCATQEDHAAGNFWADEYDNPEHRIDKIGVLLHSAPAPAPR